MSKCSTKGKRHSKHFDLMMNRSLPLMSHFVKKKKRNVCYITYSNMLILLLNVMLFFIKQRYIINSITIMINIFQVIKLKILITIMPIKWQ